MQLEQGNFAIDIPAAALSQNTLLDFDVIWNEEISTIRTGIQFDANKDEKFGWLFCF